MKFLDRVKLLIRSTVGSAFYRDSTRASSNWRRDRLLDDARAQLEILQEDLAGAEKRGDDALASRLRKEIAELQRLLDEIETRQRALGSQQRPSSATEPPSVQREAQARKSKTTPDMQHASNAQLDDTRIADQIRRLREEQ